MYMDVVRRQYIDCCWQVYYVGLSRTGLALSHFQLHLLHCGLLVGTNREIHSELVFLCSA